MKKSILGLALIASISAPFAMAETAAEKAIDYRKNVFSVIKWHFGPMAGMVKGKIDFDAADFQRRAELVAALAQMPQEGFIEGSDKGDTNAKPEIWQNKGKFDGGMKMLVENSAALAEASKSGDMAKIKPAFGKLAKNCKGCHDNFKKD